MNNKENSSTQEPSNLGAFKIGLFQCIALIPGVSRSAATIIGGITQGLNRKSAAEFSFFLAVPTMFAATAYKLLKYFKANGNISKEEINLLLVGNIVAFIVAIIAIKTFITFLNKNGFKLFGYYRIIAGIIILIIHQFFYPLTIL
jgi:undecaprenyl-diphosphatase